MPLDRLLPIFRTLPGYRFKGGWHTALCPVHEDSVNSLGLSTTKGTLQCFRGCNFRDLMAWFRTNGFEDDEQKKPEPAELTWREVATYVYTDPETGEVTGTKTRREGFDADGLRQRKEFSWTGHSRSMRDMPLWGWETIKPGEPVFWTEGEKAAEALHAFGRAAVTTGGGSSVTDLNPATLRPLKGKEVIIWRDNDEAGRKYALAIAKLLFPLADKVSIICWTEGGHGADAADYLPLHPDIKALLEPDDVVGELVSEDHIRVTVRSDRGPVSFDFEDIHSVGMDKVECELTVTMLTPTGIDTPYNCRINVLSMSSRQQLRGELTAQFGKDVANGGWTELMSKAWAKMTGLRKANQGGKSIPTVGVSKTLSWVVDGLIPADEDSILFALEGSGKSLVTTAIAACVATGHPFAGHPVQQGGVIVVDYERGIEVLAERLERVVRGMGLDPMSVPAMPIRFWPGNGIPFTDQAHMIKRLVQEIDAKLVIVDSLGFAVAGDMFSPEAPIRYYRKRLGVATLSIGQVPAADEDKLYGNKYWVYAPHGYVWKMKRTARDDYAMSTKLENVKFSDNTAPPDVDLTFYFNPDTDRRIEIASSETARKVMPKDMRATLALHLAANEDGLPAFELAKLTGQEVNTILKCLRLYPEDFELFEPSVGEVQRWRLV